MTRTKEDEARDLYFAMKNDLRDAIGKAQEQLRALQFSTEDVEQQAAIQRFIDYCDALARGLSRVT